MIYGDERLPERFWAKVYPEPNTGCWLWSGGDNGKGYGRFNLAGKTLYPHRMTALIQYGNSDLVVDHLCRQHSCCNPAHLEYVTHSVNSLRGELKGRNHPNRGKTECKLGHPLSGSNVRYEKDRRHCKTCDRMHERKRSRR